MLTKQGTSIQEFIEFVHQDEHIDRNFELINGEIIELSPSRSGYSRIAFLIGHYVETFCEEHNLPCYVTIGDGTYEILGNIIAPDMMYKSTPTEMENYPDFDPPEWAVEVISPNDKGVDIRDKRKIYLDAGIVYWEVYPKAQYVDVYAPGQPMKTFGIEDILDGGDVLPGFTLPLKQIFR